MPRRSLAANVQLDLGTTSPLALANKPKRKRKRTAAANDNDQEPARECGDNVFTGRNGKGKVYACALPEMHEGPCKRARRPRKPKAPTIPKSLYVVPRLPLPICGMDPSLTHSAGHFGLIDREFELDARGESVRSSRGIVRTSHTKLSRFSIRTDPNAFHNRLARLDAMRAAFLTELSAITRQHGPGLLVVEGYAFASRFGKTTERYEWGGQLRLSAYCMGWDVVEVAPSMLKRWTAADGAAKKLDMMDAVEIRWRYKSTDDNDADAFALSQLGSAFIKWRLGATVTSEEAEQFARLEVWEAKARSTS